MWSMMEKRIVVVSQSARREGRFKASQGDFPSDHALESPFITDGGASCLLPKFPNQQHSPNCDQEGAGSRHRLLKPSQSHQFV